MWTQTSQKKNATTWIWTKKRVTSLNFDSVSVSCSCRFDDFYFLTDPDEFIDSHFPDQEEWQLLDSPVSLEQFERRVFKTSSFFTLGLKLLQPQHAHIATGLEAAVFGRRRDRAISKRLIWGPDDVLTSCYVCSCVSIPPRNVQNLNITTQSGGGNTSVKHCWKWKKNFFFFFISKNKTWMLLPEQLWNSKIFFTCSNQVVSAWLSVFKAQTFSNCWCFHLYLTQVGRSIMEK